jgi:xanthine dehydrogenase YagT iron-sulfur-binding subunit
MHACRIDLTESAKMSAGKTRFGEVDVTRRGLLAGAGAALGAPAVIAAEPAAAAAFAKHPEVRLQVNGRERAARVAARTTLLDWLREDAGLTGAKKGCNEGACGACTVLIDDEPMNACLILLAQCEGRKVTTIEGIAAPDGSLHTVQQAFVDHDAFQCGYCTPGQILSAIGCIAAGEAREEASVREWMSGNLCRCSCYPQITAAVLDAAGKMGG